MNSSLWDFIFFGGTRRQSKKDDDLRRAIIEDTELAPKSKKLGVKSIVLSVSMFVAVAISVLCVYLLFKLDKAYIFVSIIGSILVVAVLIYMIFYCYIRSLKFLIWQFKLNKHPIRWVGLTLIILPTLLFIVAVIFFVLSMMQ